MTVRSFAVPLALLASVFACGGAAAQPPGPVGPRLSPPFSPYLNLTRQGASPAVNYYGLVRPQTQFANSLDNLQQQAGLIGQQLASNAASPDQPVASGHPFGFQNHRVYFQNQYSLGGFGSGSASGSSGRGPAAGPGRAGPGGSGPGVSPPRRR